MLTSAPENVLIIALFAVPPACRELIMPHLPSWLTPLMGAALMFGSWLVVLRLRRRWVRVATAAVRDAHRQLHSIVEAAPIAIYTANDDGTVRTWNAAAERTFGWTADEVIGRVLPIAPPEETAAYVAHRARIRAGFSITDEPALGLRHDGSRLDISLSAAPLCDAVGRVVGAVVLAADVTARRRAERALAETEARLETITAHVPGMVYQHVRRPDGSRYFRFVSDGASDVYGLDAELIRGDVNASEGLILAEDLPSFQATLRAASATLSPWKWEGRIRHGQTGAVRWLSGRARLERMADGGTLCNGVVTDVTAIKDAEAAAEAARAAAEAANLAKGEFLANMSHEIRTPLNGIVGMLQLLAGTPLDGRQRQYAATADASAAALLTLINDILDFSKIEAGKLELDPVPFDVSELACGAVAILSAKAEGKGLTLACNAEPGLAAHRVGPADRVRQVLVNLLGNAVKFTAAGSVTLTVTADTDDRVRFAVTDTGIGVPPERLDRLFKTFSQVDASTTRQYGGTGLGLAISRQLAGLLGGTIGVESEAGRGSTFWFTARLPVDPSPPAPTAMAVAKAAVARPAAGRRVLVAEDNDVNQLVVGEMLRLLGYPHDLVDDGRAAVDAVAAGGYDLVLMDCQMPNMDGFAATAAIRAAEATTGRPRLPVIALTANAIKGDRERCLAAGMDDYLPKPLDARQLAAKVAAWLASDRLAA